MTTVPDIPIVQLPALDADGVADDARTTPGSIWAVDIPHSRRLTPVTLTVLGVLAGIAAMAVGTAAVISAGSSAQPSTPARVEPAAPPTAAAVSAVERRALALLGKPSTERIPFSGVRGLVLAVGSAGRAAILIRSFPLATAGAKYNAWIVAPRAPPVRAARIAGTERAVFLARRLRPDESVVISKSRPVAGPPAGNRLVALRG